MVDGKVGAVVRCVGRSGAGLMGCKGVSVEICRRMEMCILISDGVKMERRWDWICVGIWRFGGGGDKDSTIERSKLEIGNWNLELKLKMKVKLKLKLNLQL